MKIGIRKDVDWEYLGTVLAKSGDDAAPCYGAF